MSAPRVFEDAPAVREQVPLLLGLVGPSGSGKTYSALRLATGIQRVVGGEIFGIDTEANRMKMYAENFKFRHVPFQAPFGPLDYLAAIEHCHKRGGKVVIVDSQSHEHEGPGGVLEMHETELDRIAGNDWKKRDRVNMLAWSRPKQERRRLLNTLLQLNMNFIFCFRAKEKIKLPPKGSTDKEPVPLGWQAIGGEEWLYEMTANFLLHPGANGVPTLMPLEIGEKALVKVPLQFQQLVKSGKQLDEALGESLAKWAKGGSAAASPPAERRADPAADLKAQIKVALVEGCPGEPSDKNVQAQKAEALEASFGTRRWADVEKMPADQLTVGLKNLNDHFQRAAELRRLAERREEE